MSNDNDENQHEHLGADDSLSSAPNPEPLRFRRSSSNRKIAGVAGGIGERFDVDANVVRVIFIVLALVVGLGVAIYLALWAFVPLNGSAEDIDVRVDAEEGNRWSLRNLVLLAGTLCLGLIVLSVVINRQHVGRAIGLLWLIFLVVLAVAALRRPGRFSIVRFLLRVLVAIVSLAVLACAGVLAYVVASGVPKAGAVGERIYQPNNVAEVHSQYQLAIGTMTVDLRGVGFHDDSLSIAATVAVGRLIVEVPPGVQVNLDAQSGTSTITYPYGSQSFYDSGASKGATSHLNLTVRVGIGQVELIRGRDVTPLTSLPGQP
ncbi:MAG: PspC domain-containing protein [Acidimicrobiales bacterium]